MKFILLCSFCLLMLFNINCKTTKKTGSVEIANNKNDIKADKGIVDEDIAEFLVRAADARMMDTKEAQLAIKRGTRPGIIHYGELMIKDQALLLSKIKKLAADRNISLPDDISNDKKEGLKGLNEKHGKDFDKEFVDMMRIDHKRDVKDFKKASRLPDNEITDFAAKYLVMIRSHLDKVKQLKNELK